MRGEVTARYRKAALLCVIAGVHLALLWNIDVGKRAGLRKAEEAAAILYFIEIPEPDSPPFTTPDLSQPGLSFVAPRIGSEAAGRDAITLLPEFEGAVVDWDAESRRIAGELVARQSAEEKLRKLDRPPAGLGPPPAGLGPPPPESSRPKAGDTQRFEGGEVITWINDRCYYTNQNFSTPFLAGAPVGSSDLRVQRPVCKAGAAGEPQMTFEEWKKKKGEPPDKR